MLPYHIIYNIKYYPLFTSIKYLCIYSWLVSKNPWFLNLLRGMKSIKLCPPNNNICNVISCISCSILNCFIVILIAYTSSGPHKVGQSQGKSPMIICMDAHILYSIFIDLVTVYKEKSCVCAWVHALNFLFLWGTGKYFIT